MTWPALALAIGLMIPAARPARPAASAYDLELGRVEREIAAARAGAPAGIGERMRYLHLLYRRASLTGDGRQLAAVVISADTALREFGSEPDLRWLKARAEADLHRVADARRDLDAVQVEDEGGEALGLRADLAREEGRYRDARLGYEAALARHRSWTNLARLAALESLAGDADEADRLYAAAGDEITAREMRAYAWVELQRGLLAFRRGRWDAAGAHYARADRAYPGWWLVQVQLAELLAARGRCREGAALFERTIAGAPRPELEQALGDLYAFMKRPEEAWRWYERAHAGYLASVRRGEVHYYHHLAQFCADVTRDGPEAVRWASADVALRGNPSTHEALAWALFRAGRLAEAREESARALAGATPDAHALSHAAAISEALGEREEGRRLLARAATVNPRYATTFHMHR